MNRSNSSLAMGNSRKTSMRNLRCNQDNNDLNDSCNSLSLNDLDDPPHDNVPVVITKRPNKSQSLHGSSNRCNPLRKLCRTASSRLWASVHSSKSTIETEGTADLSANSLCTEENDDHHDDDYSCCSFGEEEEEEEESQRHRRRRVRFAREPRAIHSVEHCHYMSPQQRADCWYTRHELAQLKRQIKRIKAVVNCQPEYDRLRVSLVDVLLRTQMLAAAGYEDPDDLVTYHHHHHRRDGDDDNTDNKGTSSSLSDIMAEWCRETVTGEACRGTEKHLHRSLRQPVANTVNRAIVEAHGNGNTALLAERYEDMSRYAALFARCTAEADAKVAQDW